MPLVRGTDTKGAYYRWGPAGSGGTKYHYTAGNAVSRERAKAKAMTQARAIEASRARRRRMVGGAGRWITHPGKLGGPGYMAKTAAERHRILDACVEKDGYRSCLDSVLVLDRNRTMAARHGAKIRADANYLERKYGGGAAPRRRRASPKKPSLTSAARSQRKTADKTRVARVTAYRRPGAPSRAASKRR